MNRTGGSGLVSLCIPTYNGAAFIERALGSALSQDYPNLEVIVVDDASTDGTADLVRHRADDKTRLYVQPSNRGPNANWNASLDCARGEFIKFLHQDDELERTCVSRMVDRFTGHPSLGMVFCRRRIAVDGVDPATAAAWLARYEQLDTHFSGLSEISRGPELFEQWLRQELRDNWVGEPSCVMVRSDCLRIVGGFSRFISQALDVDLWLRLMANFDVGFIPEELVSYRHGADALTAHNTGSNRHWLDHLWLLEDLAASPGVRSRWPEVALLRQREQRMVWRTALRLGRPPGSVRVPLEPWARYVWFKARRAIGLGGSLWHIVDPSVGRPAHPAAML